MLIGPVFAADTLLAAVPRHFPPQYEIGSDGRPTGFAVEILNRIAANAGFTVEYRVYDNWQGVYRALASGEVDLIPSIGITAERVVGLDVSQPIERCRVAVFVRDDNTTIRGLQDLAGHRVGLVPGSVGDTLVRETGLAQVMDYHTYLETLFALISGQVDAIVQPAPVTWSVAQGGRVAGEIRQVGLPVASIERAIAMTKGDPRLARLDAAAQAFITTPAFGQLYGKWHGAPEPFWSVQRVVIGMGSLLLLSVAGLGGWRYRTMVELGREMAAGQRHQARLNRALAALNGCNQALVRAADEHDLLDEVCRVIGETLDGVSVAVYLAKDGAADTWTPNDIPTAEWRRESRGAACEVWSVCLLLMAEGTRLGLLVLERKAEPGRQDSAADGLEFDGEEGVLLQRLADDLSFGVLALRNRADRLRAAEALQESEQRYRTLVDSLTDVVWEIDAEGRYVYVSARMRDILGYGPEDLLGRTPFDLMPPEEARRIEHEFLDLSALRLPIRHLENVNVAKDGTMVVLETNGLPVFDGDGRFRGYRGVDRDITERKHHEAALLWEADVRGVFAELGRLLLGRISIEEISRTVVDRGCRLLGTHQGCACYHDPMTGEGFCTTPTGAGVNLCSDLPSDRSVMVNTVPEGMCTGGIAEVGLQRLLSVPVTIDGRPVGRLTFADADRPFEPRDLDVAERLAASYGLALRRAWDEKALVDSRTRLETVTAAAQDGIIMMDDEGRVSFWNRAAETIFGWSEAEVVGRPLHETLVAPGAGAAYRHGFEIFRRTGQGPVVGRAQELEGVRKDGTTVPIEITVVAARLAERWTAVATVKDLTERKEAERLRREMEKRLFQAQKMDALGTLAGGVAHNFNNMLMPVMALTELTMAELPPDSPGRKRLEAVLQASRRARDLVQRILTFGRQDAPTMAPVALREVVAEALELLRSTLPRSIELREMLADLTEPVMADRSQLVTVLMNLGANAADAMEGSTGTLEVSLVPVTVAHDDQDALLGIGLPAGAYALLTVRDTGHGMDEQTVGRVFEPFFTTKSVGRGTGLGLATAQAIIAAHGGLINVDSAPGAGTRFEIYLPLVSRVDVAESAA